MFFLISAVVYLPSRALLLSALTSVGHLPVHLCRVWDFFVPVQHWELLQGKEQCYVFPACLGMGPVGNPLLIIPVCFPLLSKTLEQILQDLCYVFDVVNIFKGMNDSGVELLLILLRTELLSWSLWCFSLWNKILVDRIHRMWILLQLNEGIPCVLPSICWVH